MRHKISYIILAAALIMQSCNWLDIVPDETPS